MRVSSHPSMKLYLLTIADLMPNKIAEAIGEMIQQGLNTMKQTLENSGYNPDVA